MKHVGAEEEYRNAYVGERENGEGPSITASAADYIKLWKQPLNDRETDSSESDEEQESQVVGIEGLRIRYSMRQWNTACGRVR
ncbi:hypothetical protein Trydic_g12873 [Trypoxylus dichotomus]